MAEIKSILIANNHLKTFGGSETYTFTLIEKLKQRGYDVEYFTFEKGEISNRIENNLKVSFKSKDKYDLILANHNTCVNYLKDKGFIIQTCHGIFPELEQPSIYADFHFSISQEVANHLALQNFPSIIRMNGIDTKRFRKINEINDELRNVLSLCQSDEANIFLKKICDRLGLNFTYLNKFENGVWNVEDLINKNDLVIGLGRSAYEAMACGRPVIVYDNRPYSESFADGYLVNVLVNSLINNCSGRFYKLKMNEQMMIQEFLKYKKEDGEILRNFIVENMNIDDVVDDYISFALRLKKNKANHSKIAFYRAMKNNYSLRIAKKYFRTFEKKFYVENIRKLK